MDFIIEELERDITKINRFLKIKNLQKDELNNFEQNIREIRNFGYELYMKNKNSNFNKKYIDRINNLIDHNKLMFKNIIEETYKKIDIKCYEFEKLTDNIETKFKLLKMYIEPTLEYLKKEKEKDDEWYYYFKSKENSILQ